MPALTINRILCENSMREPVLPNDFPEWTNLGEPVPLAAPRQYKSFEWPGSGLIPLEDARSEISPEIAAIFMRRRSHRRLGKASLIELSSLLNFTCRTQCWGDNLLGFHLELRPVPSAGSIHPVHVLVSSADDEYWMRYLPGHHTMQCLDPSVLSPREVRKQLNDICDPGEATIVLFVGEPGKTSAKYGNPCSLVWRDAGNLQGFFALAAEALSLGFCQLGITGDKWARQLDKHGQLVGVGVGLLGRRI
jgi:SagB-type dehydrogenase family enzyme